MNQSGFALPDAKKIQQFLTRYKWIIMILALGMFLLLLPGKERGAAADPVSEHEGNVFDLDELERRMEKILSGIDGAGDLSLMLTVKSGVEEIYALDREYSEDDDRMEERITTVLVSEDDGKRPAVVRYDNPVFQGALVVCDGGDDPAVRLCITKALSALTGLGADKITVCK